MLIGRFDVEGPSTISTSSEELASEACADLRRFLGLLLSSFELPLNCWASCLAKRRVKSLDGVG